MIPMTRRWAISSRRLFAVVEAHDQWEAWDTFRHEDRYQFGLIATAEPDEDGDPIPVKTSALMERWGRIHDAEEFHALAREKGLEP
jgi:hypothetical protein